MNGKFEELQSAGVVPSLCNEPYPHWMRLSCETNIHVNTPGPHLFFPSLLLHLFFIFAEFRRILLLDESQAYLIYTLIFFTYYVQVV
jgi:hypothetical protein